MKAAIRQVWAREVLDSRGLPTVEVELLTAGGARGRAICPAGASTGRAEARELRDGDPAWYAGRGVGRAVGHVRETIAPAILGREAGDQLGLDQALLALDPSPQKDRLGANAILAVSLAAAHAGAAALDRPLYAHLADAARAEAESHGTPDDLACLPAAPRLPLPMTNMISGGLHAGGQLDFQDFLIQPHGAASYPVALQWLARVYRELGRLLRDAGYEGYLVGDEGGYGPRLSDARQAATFLLRASEAAGLRPGDDVSLAIDVASSHFFRAGRYHVRQAGTSGFTSDAMIDYLAALAGEFPLVSFEDGLAEEDWPGWQTLTARLGSRLWLVGDDLFATQTARLARGIASGVANSVLIKLNQVGTVSETLAAIRLARRAGYQFVVSARSGESEDTTLADLAVATAAPLIKIGSVARSERLAKYNRLLRIAEELPRESERWHGWRRRAP